MKKFLLLSLVIVWFFGGLPANAAKLYFDPQEKVIGTEGDFLVAVNITAESPVNAFSIAISISPEIFPYDINEGNSVINLWVDKPHWDENTRLLTFSGITPGGFEGKDAPLLILKLRAEEEARGEALLSFNKEQTKIYLHTPDGIEDTLELSTLHLPIAKGKENLPINLPDDQPPEPFTPIITHDPLLFDDNKEFLVFTTQDKGSGLFGYEIAEQRGKPAKDYTKLFWRVAESPYKLRDQELKSYIYVKVIDKAGYERIVMVPPEKPLAWYERYLIWGIIIIVGIIIISLIYVIWKKSRR